MLHHRLDSKGKGLETNHVITISATLIVWTVRVSIFHNAMSSFLASC